MYKRKREDITYRRYLLLALALLLLPLLLMFVGAVRHSIHSSPESLNLAYHSDGYRHVMNLATGKDTITGLAGGRDHLSAVSPDGRWLAEWSFVQASYWQLRLIRRDTGAIQRFEPLEVAFPSLSWSPDSQWLVFAAGNGMIGLPEGSEIILMNVENRTFMKLTDNGYRDDAPDFSPDGTRLAYTSAENGYNRLYIMELETRSRQVLTPYTFGYTPDWSPDGSLIAFMSNQADAHGDIYVVAPDGSGLTRLTHTPADDISPVWLR